ncbi:MAG: hypothetical protein K9I29_05105 [Bacteroidales bacterium]|nr:hypothetical protein [Bacteroidales bacterium]MCF8327651.1 hypothetical protein [Bacteroidales bacterium]
MSDFRVPIAIGISERRVPIAIGIREKRTPVKQLQPSRFIPFDWSKINGTSGASTTRNNEQGTRNKNLNI